MHEGAHLSVVTGFEGGDGQHEQSDWDEDAAGEGGHVDTPPGHPRPLPCAPDARNEVLRAHGFAAHEQQGKHLHREDGM